VYSLCNEQTVGSCKTFTQALEPPPPHPTIEWVKSKGKIYSRTGHEGSEGEWRYNSTLSLTSALDGDGWLAPPPGRFAPGEREPALIV
jgi:hypothetical protein